MYLYFAVKTAIFLPKMATNTLEMAGFSTEKTWFFSFQESSGYINSTRNMEKVLSKKHYVFMKFRGKNATIITSKKLIRQ